MAHSTNLSTQALDSLVRRIGDLIAEAAEPSLLNRTPIELRESFEVWMLGLDALMYGAAHSRSLSQLARPSGRWHHQITFGGDAAAFARSSVSPTDPEQHIVEELFVLPLATRIHQAIDWIVNNAPGDPMVCLLTVRSYYLHALWLKEPVNQFNRVLVVDVSGVGDDPIDTVPPTLHGLTTRHLHEESY